jgi:glycosyltransferase involved in cell wall biosynthesis
MLKQITPVLLTRNEELNIGRTLSRLQWASDIVIVDSGSTDATVSIAAAHPNVRVFQRTFDTHASQWRYAIEQTNIGTDWILRLDADYQLSDALLSEIASLDPAAPVNAYRVRFDYAIYSRKLISALYPANTILLRKGTFRVWDKGHTEAWSVTGPVANLRGRVVHDDWKPVAAWVLGQSRYMQLELRRLQESSVGVSHWLRLRPPLMPIIIFIYCLFAKGLILNGRAGLFYALQRMIAEAILSLMVLDAKLRESAGVTTPKHRESDQYRTRFIAPRATNGAFVAGRKEDHARPHPTESSH